MSESSTQRRPLARHGQQSKPTLVGQLMRIVGIVAAVVLVSGLGAVGYVALSFTSKVQANAVELEGQGELPPDIAAYSGGFDLLLTGVDTCEEKYAHLFGDRCDESHMDDSTLNDVNLLVHVSAEPRRITAVSFPRDLMVPIPSCEDEDGNVSAAMSKQPLNSAWQYGGLSCVAKTIGELVGEDIEFAASVTFGGVIEITDAIGGVDVCLAKGIKDENTGLDMKAGNHTVEGVQALQFLRTRKGVGDGSDLGRIGNQQQYMSSLARKMMSSETLGNVPVMLKLADTALNNLKTSTSLTDPMKIVQIALAVKDVPLNDIVFVQYPNGTDAENPNKVMPDWEAAEALWAAISANKQLEITHESTENDGVIVEKTEEPATPAAPETSTPEPTAEATKTPTEVAQLPSNVKGNSAAQKTCSNGNVG